ncbi:medium-chain acyl-CoA ligase ACSF2, mitochondrial [Plodia interpunctella]|uniref:medium-chain acyl-CoA ligase ACSF2, mitochondrial n=1 Tax=Plodia interpunctella TaxID=58824 RepID=UPI002367854F|nr:medium-chain acyl-CoA ligase ACSF2, mitochondrial [Plodia interpunctella]
MWSKSVTTAVNKINYCDTSRFARYIQSASKDSYVKHPGAEPLNYDTYGQVLQKTVEKYPGRVAVRSLHEDVTFTYDELLTQADSLGCALRAHGLEKGDRIGLWSHNTATWVVSLLAAARVGLIAALLNPVFEAPELSFIMKKTGMKALVIPEKLPNRDYYTKLKGLLPELGNTKPGSRISRDFPNLTTVVNTGNEKLPGTLSYQSLITHNNNDVSKYCNEIKYEDGCLLHLTSGTTGDPKAGLDSHLGIVNNTYFSGVRNTFNEYHHKVCIQVPLFHALGSIITALAGIQHGSTLVLAAPTYNIQANLDTLYAENCTSITGTPTMYVDMLAQVQTRASPPPSLKFALAAGAPCSPLIIRNMQKYLNVDTVGCLYGLTETTAAVFQSHPGDSIDLVAETVGHVHDHCEVKVIDDNGKPVPMGSEGELCTRGYNNMMGYWDEPEKTRQTITEDGWVLTGDKFKLTEDGYGIIVGRLKDIIIRGGENIAPKEIEDLLNTHPDIVESQVVGVADERLGEELCAVLRVREGVTLTTDDIRRHCDGRLAKFKIPRMLKFTDEFPKTTSGKIQKFKVKDLVEKGKI